MRAHLYLSGPMTGLPDFNAPAFNAAAQTLRSLGHTVFNPVENGVPPEAEWAEHMRADIAALTQCAALVALPGCENSRGAQLEIHIAKCLDMPIYQMQQMLDFTLAHAPTNTTQNTATA